MAEEQLNPEVSEIFQAIEAGENFLLSGGAGSGKTYSLVQVITEVTKRNPKAQIACMTFTNAAIREIQDRISHVNLKVATIHDFLWDSLKSYQKELKATLIELINDDDVRQFSLGDEKLQADYYANLLEGIQYKEWVRLAEGIISHDELIILAERMFSKYDRLVDVLKDKYKFIFIDEYQDTSPLVVKIFLTHFSRSDRKNIVGFFGDAMQSIYDDGIGNLDDYKGIGAGHVVEIKKKQNRRNPQSVIDLANLLRTDGLKQQPSEDLKAPNMIDGIVKQGKSIFIHSKSSDLNQIKNYLIEQHGWTFTNPALTKELNLTHNLIADKAGFKTLMDIYDKDYILDYKKRIRDYIKDNSITTDFSENTFGEVIDILSEGKVGNQLRPIKPTPTQQAFIDENNELFQKALATEYAIFSNIYFDKDQLIDDKKQNEDDKQKKGSKRDRLISHLMKIQTTIMLYNEKRYNEFLQVCDYSRSIKNIADKKKLKDNIEAFANITGKNIGDMITEANSLGIVLVDDKLEEFIKKNEYLFHRVKNVDYVEFQKLFEYLEGKTPFSTQHKTKGAEFDNVLVILDNGNWNKYNFSNLFLNTGTPSVLERTQKIFYVCCTRSKENLAVFYHNPSDLVVAKASSWFGTANVIEI